MSVVRPWNEPTFLKWKRQVGVGCVFGSLIMVVLQVMHITFSFMSWQMEAMFA